MEDGGHESVDVGEDQPKAKRPRNYIPAVPFDVTGMSLLQYGDPMDIGFLLQRLFQVSGVTVTIEHHKIIAFVDDREDSEMENSRNLVCSWEKEFGKCDNCKSYVIDLSCTRVAVCKRVASLAGLLLAKWLNSGTVGRKFTSMFSSVSPWLFDNFAHDVDDILSNTRVYWMQLVGLWIRSCPPGSVPESCLSCIYWALHKSADVKRASLLALLGLSTTTVGYESHLQAVARRLIVLVGDDDMDVAVHAVAATKLLLSCQLLTDEDSCNFYKNLMDVRPEVKHAVGKVVYDVLIASSEGVVDSLDAIGRMLQFLRKTPPDLIDYAIDGVWWHMEAMQDWKLIISTLIKRSPPEFEKMLIRLLFISVRKAVGETIFPPELPSTDNKELRKKRIVLTLAMMDNYPDLLREFKNDKEIVEIIMRMDLELYSLDNTIKMVEIIMDAFFECDTEDGMISYAMAIKLLTDNLEEEHHRVVFTKKLGDKLALNLRRAMDEAREAEEDEQEDAGGSLVVNMKRLFELERRCHSTSMCDTITTQFFKVLAESIQYGIKPALVSQILSVSVKFALEDPPLRVSFLTRGPIYILPELPFSLPWPAISTLTSKLIKDMMEITLHLNTCTPRWYPHHDFFDEVRRLRRRAYVELHVSEPTCQPVLRI